MLDELKNKETELKEKSKELDLKEKELDKIKKQLNNTSTDSIHSVFFVSEKEA